MNMNKFWHRVVYAGFVFALVSHAVAYDVLDPNGNITIKWDIVSWTPDGYVAVVTMKNFQMYRQITNPGWTLGWTWAKNEIIWSMLGAQAIDQGDCSKFTNSSIPHSCKKTPNIVDLLPGAPYSHQITDCCKGGKVASRGQDPDGAASAFQLTVGRSGKTNETVSLPKNFTLLGPGRGYTCGQAVVVRPSVFLAADGRRITHAMMTWNVTCTYSQLLASRSPTCCVSMSSFYNPEITPCPDCACSCPKKYHCDKSDTKIVSVAGTSFGANPGSILKCTAHMCPIQVHWHVKTNYKEHWRAKITITNFRYGFNHTQWTLVVQHPNFNNITQIFSFEYKPLVPYLSTNDSGMLYGIKHYNDILTEAGEQGNVQSELIMQKDRDAFTLKQGWAFPRKVYFNGDECAMPHPDSYPSLPNTSPLKNIVLPFMVFLFVLFVSIVL